MKLVTAAIFVSSALVVIVKGAPNQVDEATTLIKRAAIDAYPPGTTIQATATFYGSGNVHLNYKLSPN